MRNLLEPKISLVFKSEDGFWAILSSHHKPDCCEIHYLDFSQVDPLDFEGLEFNFEGQFFEKVEGFGIRLLPSNKRNMAIPIPGYGINNGYYSTNLTLVLTIIAPDKKIIKKQLFDIEECQVINLES